MLRLGSTCRRSGTVTKLAPKINSKRHHEANMTSGLQQLRRANTNNRITNRRRSTSSRLLSTSSKKQQPQLWNKKNGCFRFNHRFPCDTTTTTTTPWWIMTCCVVVVGAGYATVSMRTIEELLGLKLSTTTTTSCESQLLDSQTTTVISVKNKRNGQEMSVWSQIKRIVRLIRRLMKLTITLSPVIALYPIQSLLIQKKKKQRDGNDEDAHDIALSTLLIDRPSTSTEGPIGWYYKLCLACIEWSGAAPIKIMQWAGSRPDMFGAEFCNIFSQLQDDTTPHSWSHTEKLLREAFGEDWSTKIELNQKSEILGSGCIAQVYKGRVMICDSGSSDASSSSSDQHENRKQEVAIKVMHPNVEDDIDADLDIMRLSSVVLERMPFDVFKNLKWLNITGFIDEMESMLKIQLDLRTEAKNLERFGDNFKDNDLVVFPKLIDGYKPTKSVLVETFEEGVPIMDFIRNNTEDRQTLSEMCRGAIEVVCQMIFLDNFLHADLHPGNVLITPDKKLVLLDCGIVTEHSRDDHRLISDVLSAFIYCDGRKAGRRMIEDSNARLKNVGDYALEEELFCDKIEQLTLQARGKDYLMEKLGTYISYICNAAATHHVMINQSFMSAALAVKVQEGIALALDPSIQIWKVAIPIILEGERRQGFAKDRASEMIGLDNWDDFIKWLTGYDSSSSNKEDKKVEVPKYLTKLPRYKPFDSKNQ